MTALFPQAKCSLPSIPAVDFEFVSECEVLPAPAPIFDQPDIEIPLDFPPPRVIVPPICIPCPTLHASATLEFVEDSLAGADMTVTQIGSVGSCESEPNCEFQFNLNLRLPCVDMSATGTMHFTEGSSESEAPVPIAVTRLLPVTPGDPCQYHFDFDFQAFFTSNVFQTFITQIFLDLPCLPQLVNYTLLGDLNSGGTAVASTPDGTVLIGDYNVHIPSGKKIKSGAKGWAWRVCSGSSFIYHLATANKCPE